jgi:transketolase
VKIAGHHAGISVGPDGATHQATEDIAMMRVLPNMRVIVPCDAIEARKATVAAAHIWGPVYLRFAREKTPVFTTDMTPFAPGRIQALWETKHPDVLVVGCGPLLYNALLAARALEKDKVEVTVVNCHTVKPLDEKTLVALAKRAGAVVTVEEHQIAGGLGGAVAEALAKHEPVPQEFVGLHDTFGESGSPSKLLEKYGMDVAAIKSAIKKVLKRKK